MGVLVYSLTLSRSLLQPEVFSSLMPSQQPLPPSALFLHRDRGFAQIHPSTYIGVWHVTAVDKYTWERWNPDGCPEQTEHTLTRLSLSHGAM